MLNEEQRERVLKSVAVKLDGAKSGGALDVGSAIFTAAKYLDLLDPFVDDDMAYFLRDFFERPFVEKPAPMLTREQTDDVSKLVALKMESETTRGDFELSNSIKNAVAYLGLIPTFNDADFYELLGRALERFAALPFASKESSPEFLSRVGERIVDAIKKRFPNADVAQDDGLVKIAVDGPERAVDVENGLREIFPGVPFASCETKKTDEPNERSNEDDKLKVEPGDETLVDPGDENER